MSATAQEVSKVAAAVQAGLGVVVLRGKIGPTQRFEVSGDKVTETELHLAAVDEYSMPGVVQVRHLSKLGQVGEVVTVRCRVAGFPRMASVADRGTGEMAKRRFVTNTLTVIE